MYESINGIRLHQLFLGGYYNLKKNMTAINDLNVFPVPDGDTGTNMVFTLGGLLAVKEDIPQAGTYMRRLSEAVLLSARGNSGVILSQFVHGLYRGLSDKEQITFSDLASAFACAREDAYNAVITPVEGTMLTLIREADEFLSSESFPDFESGLAALITRMERSLAHTPELLPVLKEANVVDSGGAGLLCLIKGLEATLRGESIEDTPEIADMVQPITGGSNFGPDSVLEYGYCTEFILQLMHAKTNLSSFDIRPFIQTLEAMGDSIVAVHNEGIVKIHIHTFTPEKVLGYARNYGEFVSVKIENMSVQHSEAAPVEQKRTKYAIVATASGEGIIDYFHNIGADAVIDGGQTNNPSVNDFLSAFAALNAENIVVLPNNSNIIFTANQAAEMYTAANVTVIPTKSIVEGYSAISMMNPAADTVEELVSDMTANLSNVSTCYVTQAIRDAVMNGQQVKKDAWMGLEHKDLIVQGESRVQVAEDLIRAITEESEKDVIIVFKGAAVTADEAAALEEQLQETYPLCDIGFIDGKQNVYDFIISLE